MVPASGGKRVSIKAEKKMLPVHSNWYMPKTIVQAAY